MNFASLMSAQIAKGKGGTSSSGPDNKFLKRSEVEEARQKAYLQEQAALEAERQAKAERKRQREEDEAAANLEREVKRKRLAEESKQRKAEEDEKAEKERRKRLGLPDLPTQAERDKDKSGEDSSAAGGVEDMAEGALVDKLRKMEEPVRLFGETHAQRLSRYDKLVKAKAKANALSQSKTAGPIPTFLEPVPEVDMKVSVKLPAAGDVAARLFLARQLTSWFSLVLREWAIALASRDDEVKHTFAGRAAESSMIQAIEHLKPMFRKLERCSDNPAELPDDLLAPIAEIVHAAQERRYVDANDGYLRLSIGKAAWPIGVTMVGIHERSAREKLHESDKGKAHIMSDEVTRKILQSIKRCLSFAQTRWPPEDLGQLMG